MINDYQICTWHSFRLWKGCLCAYKYGERITAYGEGVSPRMVRESHRVW
jgi:hypothetical protein